MTHRERFEYGPSTRQFAMLYLPDSSAGRNVPVVVLIHGGFWRNTYELDLMEPLAADLVARGVAVWNIEYRSIGDDGGGYPGTLTDVAAALDHLTVLNAPIDLGQVSLVGHSAGGHLALWAASRHLLASSDPGSHPAVTPSLVVSLAGVADLAAGAEDRLSHGVVQELLGGEPDEAPDAYRVAQPIVDGSITKFVHGDLDDIVPVSQSQNIASDTGAEMALVVGADHFDVINPDHEAWSVVLNWLGVA